jgi:hypothetical protein
LRRGYKNSKIKMQTINHWEWRRRLPMRVCERLIDAWCLMPDADVVALWCFEATETWEQLFFARAGVDRDGLV